MNTTLNTATPADSLIEVSHICTRFGAATVHADVSLTIKKDEVFAIAGGNGMMRIRVECVVNRHAIDSAERTIAFHHRHAAAIGQHGVKFRQHSAQ